MDKFEQYKLSLTGKQKDMVNGYLLKVKNFIAIHEIEKSLYADIEEMVFEKLSLEKDITDLKVIKMLQEVWEPEVIFADYVENISPNKELIYEKLKSQKWTRDNKDAIFLWISKTLWEKISISVLAVRILLLVLIFPLGISIWFYILAWILFPVVWVDYSGKTNMWYLRTQMVLVIRNGVYNISVTFLKILAFVSKCMVKIFSWVVHNVIPVLRFLFFGFIAFLLCIAIFWLLWVWSMYYTQFTLENIVFLESFPWYFIYAIIFWILSLGVFFVWSILFAINKKNVNRYILWIWGISFLVAVFFVLSTGLDLAQKYTQKTQFIQKSEINIENTGSYVIDLKNLNNRDYFDIDFSNISSIRLEKSTGSILKIEILNTIYANNEIADKLKNGFSQISFSAWDNYIKLSLENNKTFSKKIPFTPYKREIILYIPDNIKLQVQSNKYYYFENASVKDMGVYKNFTRADCNNSAIWYSFEEQKFVCDLQEEELQYVKKEYLKQYLREHFDEISPIKHKEAFKRKYYGDYGLVSDWHFASIDFVQTGSVVNLQFWDRSLDILASLKLEETASGVVMSDLKIEDIQVDRYQFDEKYYESVEVIKPYITQA